MLLVGLTGGIGAGKSTVAARLAELGAHVIDADAVAREVVEPGQPALADLVAAFGAGILQEDGSLDRAGLAAIAFDDADARARLDAITHPHIEARIDAQVRAHAAAATADGRPRIVVVDHPLLIETGQAARFDDVVVVLAPVELRVARLRDGRNVDAEDARARMAAQADDDERRAAATHVVMNDGTLEELRARVDDIYAELAARAARDRGRSWQ